MVSWALHARRLNLEYLKSDMDVIVSLYDLHRKAPSCEFGWSPHRLDYNFHQFLNLNFTYTFSVFLGFQLNFEALDFINIFIWNYIATNTTTLNRARSGGKEFWESEDTLFGKELVLPSVQKNWIPLYLSNTNT